MHSKNASKHAAEAAANIMTAVDALNLEADAHAVLGLGVAQLARGAQRLGVFDREQAAAAR